MAITLKRYLSAGHPDDDADASGGAIALTAVPLEAQFSAAARPEIDSDNAGDDAEVTIVGRSASGAVISEMKALNGTSAVLFDATFERIQSISLNGAAAGSVTVAQGTGGTVRHTFIAGETSASIFFRNAVAEVSGGDPVLRYEKHFWRNQDATKALLDAEVELTADPTDRFEIALDATQGASTSVANRLAAPGGLTFVDDGVAQAVPDDDLATETGIGVWVKQTLPAGAAAAKLTFTTQITGSEA